jgi:tetratricopeptide (TPR) repeat protein
MSKNILTAAGLIFALTTTTDSPLLAQAASGWIGKRVVPKKNNFTLLVNGEPVERGGNGIDFYRIEQVDGSSLLLAGDTPGPNGWAPSEDVVLVEQAVDFFGQQIRAHPDDPFFRAARALLWRDRKAYASALRDYDEAIRLDPKNASHYCGRGLAWHSAKKYDKAIADFDAAIAVDPKSALGLIGRGASRASLTEYGKAIADFSEAIWLDPLAIAAYDGRGLAWYAKREFAKAVVDFNMIIRLDSRHIFAYCHRGNAWAALRKFDKALADYNQAIQIDENCARAHGSRAWILSTCPETKYRDATSAVASATRACELTDWSDSALLDVLAAAYAEAGDFATAVKWQNAANALYRDVEGKTLGRSRLRLFEQKQPVRDPEV